MKFDKVVRKRGMVRAFGPEPVEDEKIKKLLDFARRAPSAGFTQPVEIVLIRDPRTMRALVKAAWGQAWVGAAPVILAVCADTQRSGARYGDRGIYRYSIIDAAFAGMLILLTAVNEGLGACFVGAFDDTAVRRILGLPEYVLPVALIPVGYSAERPPRYKRRPLESQLHFDRW